MKFVRVILKVISFFMLLLIIGFIVYFGLAMNGYIESPYGSKVELISLSQSEIRLKRNKSFQLTSKVYPENARNRLVKYKSDNPNVVTVNELTGYVESKSNGIATITAYLDKDENIKAECLIVVSDNNIKIEKITVNPKTINLQEGRKYQIGYSFFPKDATLHEIEYMTSDPDVVSIDKTGMIEAIAEGQAYVTVSDRLSGVSDEALVKVYKKDSGTETVEPEEITVTPKQVKINVDGSKQISAKVLPVKANQSVTWESVDTKIAVVNSKGVITGKKVGSTKVVATTINGLNAIIDVTVTDEVIGVTGISVEKNNITLDVGKSAEIKYTIKPSNATNQGVTITSSDVGVAKIDGTRIIAVDSGTAVVKIRTKDGGYEAKINVKVNKVENIIDETDIQLSTTNVSLVVGETNKVTAIVLPKNATYKTVTWSSNNTSIATVNNGLIEGKKAGSTEIIVTTSHKNISKTIKVTVTSVDVQKIALNKSALDLVVGSKEALTVIFTPSNATNKTIKWTSSDTSVATVKDGLVVAKGVGTATITAKSNNGKTATCKVTVKADNVPVQSIKLNVNVVNTTVNDEIHLTATVEPSNATNKTIKWTSSDPKVATVSDGVVKTKSVGTATITAESSNGKKDTCTINVKSSIIDVQSIILNTNELSIKISETTTLKASVLPEDATNKTIVWTSSDSSIATVSSSGVVKGIKKGTATITAKSNNGKVATCKVNVQDSSSVVEVTGVSLSSSSIKLQVQASKTLTATVSPSNATNKIVTWTSSNPSIATVNSSGVVTGVKEGTATITATSNNGKTAKCTVTVEKATVAVTGVKLDKTSITVKVDATKTLVATVEPSNATDQTITWSSSDTSVATVNSSGVVKGIKVGIATITATSSNGKTATCKVTVEKATTTIAVTGVKLDNTSITLKVDGTKTLVATVEPSNATDQTITWTSSDTSVATVSASGKVKGIKVGTATITAKSNNGKTATCKVTVEAKTIDVTSVSLDRTTLTLKVDGTKTLVATVYPDNATDQTITWSSSDTSVATVSSSGKVKGIKAGTATITAKSNNGKTATCKVTVEPQTIEVTGITLSDTSISIKVDETKTLTATVEPSNATDKTVTWSSSDTGVATVSSSGKVKGIKAGEATITAKTNNGKKATCKVTVKNNTISSYIITKDSKYDSYDNKAFYDSDTLKYRIISYKSQDIVLIWIADPTKQLESALAYSNAQGTLPAETILKNEITNYNLKNKGLVAVNASFFGNGTPKGGIVRSHGKFAKNNGNASAAVIGVNSKGKLKLYVDKPASTFTDDAVHSTFVISSNTAADHGTDIANRTQICQYDNNNFVLLSGSGTVSGCGNIIINLTGCATPFNLDGGGSRKLYYKTGSMSEPKRIFGGDRQLPDMLYFVEQ